MSRMLTILLVTALALILPLAGCSGQQNTQAPELADQAPPPPAADTEAPPAQRTMAQSPPPRAPAQSVPEDRPAPAPTPPKPSTISVTVPEGTNLTVTMDESLTSETATVGTPVSAVLQQPIIAGDRVVFPAGSRVEGQVTGVKPATKGFKDTGGAIAVAFETIVAPDGRSESIVAGFTKVAEGSGKKKGAIIGGSAAGGAILGKVLGKDAGGAAIIGGAIGTAVAGATKGKEAELEVGEEITVALEQTIRTSVRR